MSFIMRGVLKESKVQVENRLYKRLYFGFFFYVKPVLMKKVDVLTSWD